jgi:hypothetical protein
VVHRGPPLKARTRAEKRALYEERIAGLKPSERRLLHDTWWQKHRPRALLWPRWPHQLEGFRSLHQHGLLESCRDCPPGPYHVEFCRKGCYRPTALGWNVILVLRELKPVSEALGLWDLLDPWEPITRKRESP